MMATTELTAAAEPAAQTIATGRVGALGGWKVGVSDVYIEPLRAELVFWTNASGAPWESTQIVMPGQVVFADGAVYRVQMAPGAAGGSVDLAPAVAPPGPGLPADAVILAAGGGVRVDGPDIATATDIRVLRWSPDEQQPQSVEVEFWPAKWGRAATKPEDFRRVELTVGAHARFGHTDAVVVSLAGATADHPGWVVLHLSRGS